MEPLFNPAAESLAQYLRGDFFELPWLRRSSFCNARHQGARKYTLHQLSVYFVLSPWNEVCAAIRTKAEQLH
jgi:hypothetical protein